MQYTIYLTHARNVYILVMKGILYDSSGVKAEAEEI